MLQFNTAIIIEKKNDWSYSLNEKFHGYKKKRKYDTSLSNCRIL